MMRKEDLKKHYREEKIASAVERVLLKSVLITFLYFSNLSAQIPINGFCRYREFTTKSNYTNIFSVDYNSDGYRDLLIYNPTQNKYSTLTSDDKSNFGFTSEKYSSAILSDIHPFGNETSGKRFLIASRKTRQVVLASFSRSGAISVMGKVTFNGYPANIDVGDIDGDGKPDGLVSGNALDGLYILKEKKRTIEETKIVKGKVFSWSGFIDLDYDLYPDIAAIDQTSNSIILYYNNHSGGFTESRSIGLSSDVSACKATDFNSDGFTDLVLVKNNSFEVLLGDSVSSFHKKLLLDTPVTPDKFVILDFNGDGFNDIAYINQQTGELYISFAKSGDAFYSPILFIKKNNLVSITAYIDRTGKKIAALTSDGKIYLINTIGINDASFSITGGDQPSVVNSFDYMNDKFKDICYIDNGEQSLKLLLSERSNLFRTYYSIPLSKTHSKIFVDDISPRTKTFYLYSIGERIIEIVRMNFETNNYTKLILYADKPIEDLKISSDLLKDRQTLSILSKKDGNLFMQIHELRNFRKASSVLYTITSDEVEKAWLALSVYKDIYSFSRSGNKIELAKSVFDKKIVEKKTLLNFDISAKENLSYDLICINEMVHRYKPVVALVTVNNFSSLYYFTNKDVIKYSLRHSASTNALLGYSFDESNDEFTFFYNDLRRKKLRSVKFRDSNKKLVGEELIESKNINNYLVTGLNRGKTFLIYSNSLQNTLSFEKL